MKYPRIHIVNLGDFTVKHWNIDDKIEMLEKWGNKDFPGIQQMKAKWNTDELMFSLKNMKDMLAVEQQRKEFINLHKKTKHGKHKDI